MSSQIDLPEILCNFFCNVGTGEIKIITVGCGTVAQLFTLAVDNRLVVAVLGPILDDLIYQCVLDMWEFPSNLLVL